ncbi:MAG: hypothetical protein GY950_00945 [bacterium]|nr:hypothetical protein [bacterium]
MRHKEDKKRRSQRISTFRYSPPGMSIALPTDSDSVLGDWAREKEKPAEDRRHIKRRHLFEFSDLPWWPKVFRRILTDFLQTVYHLVRPFNRKLDLITAAVEASGSNRIVDLCSGSGGPWPGMVSEIEARTGKQYEVLLTDKYPDGNIGAQLKSAAGVRYVEEPVDALAVPKELTGTRTLFDAFHHFRPDKARMILRDAVSQQQPIVVFELMRRTIPDLIPMFFAWFHILLVTPFIRPFSLKRLFFTYVIPVAPFIIPFDGIVSTLRGYRAYELMEMATSLEGSEEYTWETGEYKKAGLFPVTYLVGIPKR